MASSNTPCPSSPSESDSDREPNSRGGRVFWGNLKTPEKSRSVFVDPPQTVVRTRRASHTQTIHESTELPIPVLDNRSSPNISSIMEERDVPLTAVHLNNTLKELKSNQGQYGEAPDHSRSPLNDDNVTTNQVHPSSCLSELSNMEPQLSLMEAPSFAASESKFEREHASQPSSLVDALSSQDVFAQENSKLDPLDSLSANHTVALPTQQPVIVDPRPPPASELPDLISFDMLTPLRPLIPDSQSHSSQHPAPTPPCQLSSSSSNAAVDDLLTLSPVQLKSPSQTKLLSLDPRPSDAHVDSLDEATVSLDNSERQISPVTKVSSDAGCCTTRIETISEPIPSSRVSLLSTNDNIAPPLQRDTTTSNNGYHISTPHPCIAQNESTTPIFEVPGDVLPNSPKQALSSLSSTSQGQTRKRSPLKGSKGKEKAHVGDIVSTESSNNHSRESPGPARSGDESTSDRMAIKERRAKAKREAERSRQLLLSLSPTSANVLSLLASPDRDSSTSHFPSTALDETVADLAIISQMSNIPAHVEPLTPQRTPARRVPISASPQRPKSLLRFIAPSPINLDDPNRTPARRILVSPDPQTPRPLPLDDPNRIPARRVAVQSSPTRTANDANASMPRIQIEEGSPLKQTMLSIPEQPSQSTSKLHGNARTSPSPSRQTQGMLKPLPFPIRQDAARSSTIVTTTAARALRPNIESGTTRQQASASVLRQAPSISTSKLNRIATKPYSRPAQAPSRLPVSASLRGTIPSVNSASIINTAGPSKLRPPPAVVVPSRIPSPSKRSVPPVKFQKDRTPTIGPASVNDNEDKAHVFTAYKRKRQRMISEDDPDEPPAKRAVIMVRPVIKGMYNKALTNNSDVVEPTMIQKEASPVRRPQGPIQIRPVIPGTLRHFETSRSSSRDILDDTKIDSNSAIQATATGGSSVDVVVPRGATPSIDTDTGSTVTTLSREPTLEELADSSAPRSDTPMPIESGPELRRTTRIRKPSGLDALGMPSVSTSANKRDNMSLSRTTSMIQQGGTMSSKSASRPTTRPGTMQLDKLPLNPRQLQALTDANTLRNQTYLADLQRKVVRQHGPRPPSPSSKVRTMSEKSKEERAKEREARAERRRRRGLGSNISASSEGDYGDPPSSPTPDQQAIESHPPVKHARGPGDEEEYETPVRPPKPSVLDPSKVAKTVKWDRGLARTISEWATTQLTKDTHERAKSEPIGKGCLVRDRTTLRLDPFGNVPDANIPLEDLGRERIIITRFVYDDDIEATRTVKKKKT